VLTLYYTPENPTRSDSKAQTTFFYIILDFYVHREWIPCAGEPTAAFRKI